MNHMKERSTLLLQNADKLSGKYDYITNWYDSRNKTIADNAKKMMSNYDMTRKRVNTLWDERCKAQEVLQKRDHDSEDQGNPDTSASSAPQRESVSTQIVVYQPQQPVTTQGTSGGSKDDVAQLESSTDLQERPTVDRQDLEDGEFISEMTDEQIVRLTDMKGVDEPTINEITSEPDTTNLEGGRNCIEGDVEKSKYVREHRTEFNPFDEDWLKDNVDEIDEKLKNRDSSDVQTDSFKKWRKNFLLKTAKPAPPVAQVDYMRYEKNRPSGGILSWMFVKELHCVDVKREHGIQYFNSLLSILTLPFYDVAVLARLELIDRSNYEGAMLFAQKLQMERLEGWELYKPQFPMYEQIKFTLDPATNTARYMLVYR
ncbi:hypothetical protein HanLR1_Chr00c0450g0752121 [Helianthus annuus]|nr:hypothetical protein HanLR1_Chr00c0450g0752121 [Helianthus annuus]